MVPGWARARISARRAPAPGRSCSWEGLVPVVPSADGQGQTEGCWRLPAVLLIHKGDGKQRQNVSFQQICLLCADFLYANESLCGDTSDSSIPPVAGRLTRRELAPAPAGVRPLLG